MSKTDLPCQTLRIQTSASRTSGRYGVARDVVAESRKEPMSATTASRARSCPVVPRNARLTKRTIDECSIVTWETCLIAWVLRVVAESLDVGE